VPGLLYGWVIEEIMKTQKMTYVILALIFQCSIFLTGCQKKSDDNNNVAAATTTNYMNNGVCYNSAGQPIANNLCTSTTGYSVINGYCYLNGQQVNISPCPTGTVAGVGGTQSCVGNYCWASPMGGAQQCGYCNGVNCRGYVLTVQGTGQQVTCM